MTRLGDFWKFLVMYFSIKVAQIYFEIFWAILKSIPNKLKPAVEFFWQLIEEIGLHFILTSGYTEFAT